MEVFVLESTTGRTLGYFEYLSIPRVGEWILLADNDGSGDEVWVVDIVVNLPYRDGNPGSVAIHATRGDRYALTMEVNEIIRARAERIHVMLERIRAEQNLKKLTIAKT